MSDTKYSKIIIDGHNLYNRTYYANKNLTFRVEGHTIVTGGIYGFLRSLNSIQRKYLSDNGEVYILFDNATSQLEARRRLDPEYKSQRKDKPESFYRSVEYLQLILLRYQSNMYVVYRHKYEADDLVETVLSSFSSYDRTLLVSMDLDWARSIRSNVHWLSKDTIYDQNLFESEFGFRPSFSGLSLFKAFKGDSADNIKNPIPRFPWEALRRIIENYNDIYHFYKDVDSGNIDFIKDSWLEKLRNPEVRAHLIKNYELVSFAGAEYDEIENDIYECKYSEKSKGSLKFMYSLLGFRPERIDERFAGSKEHPLVGWDVLDRA